MRSSLLILCAAPSLSQKKQPLTPTSIERARSGPSAWCPLLSASRPSFSFALSFLSSLPACAHAQSYCVSPVLPCCIAWQPAAREGSCDQWSLCAVGSAPSCNVWQPLHHDCKGKLGHNREGRTCSKAGSQVAHHSAVKDGPFPSLDSRAGQVLTGLMLTGLSWSATGRGCWSTGVKFAIRRPAWPLQVKHSSLHAPRLQKYHGTFALPARVAA